MGRQGSLALLLSIILIGETIANEYDGLSSHQSHQSTVTSAPIHVSEQQTSRNRPYNQPQLQQKPSVLTQSYQVLPESRNYYQYPQYLPTHTGYSNIQTVGQPYQMYGSAPGSNVVSGGNSESYGYNQQAPVPTVAPAPVHFSERQRSYSAAPTPPSPFSETRERENNNVRAPGHHAPAQQGHRSPSPPPSPFMINPKPVLSYGAANPFLANLPPAQGVYGAPIDSSHRGYDGFSLSAPAPPSGSSASVDDTWEALEASLDANTRRRHRIF
ncbi:Prion-like-(Q/N-rich)-domain-bearing protein [Caenorhabditis elegans]|uniref:Prion-like-(Q/N-rich)-domain-bearing protein n=1 Tax=Caenorhabditis elegans TaxID=6239 RepID=Q21095_CAEEL|nr:Prion-like-(Q/N-rich)-domain-bearing protein [Caenorhabditis elegans]CAA99872.2 Prion-like-(Q/N-rich)-domain-bearing protein [Caenorhabditis elegans]|eukprot:NP_506104.2 Uncharacterized protein CELE_K01D12.5 [Caenorhabditis elegans]